MENNMRQRSVSYKYNQFRFVANMLKDSTGSIIRVKENDNIEEMLSGCIWTISDDKVKQFLENNLTGGYFFTSTNVFDELSKPVAELVTAVSRIMFENEYDATLFKMIFGGQIEPWDELL